MMSDPPYAIRLREVVAAAQPRLAAITDAVSAQRSRPGKWSAREVIGHLVDSAMTNHQRLLRAVAQEDLVFPGYPQDAWVALQAFHEAPWQDLVTLWAALNRHIARVMPRIPAAVRAREHTHHNLDSIAWREVPLTTPTTLDYLMNDYVGHLEHHLRQVLGAEWEARAAPGG